MTSKSKIIIELDIDPIRLAKLNYIHAYKKKSIDELLLALIDEVLEDFEPAIDDLYFNDEHIPQGSHFFDGEVLSLAMKKNK
jgi:Mg2+ and Co2+ transporter CorA